MLRDGQDAGAGAGFPGRRALRRGRPVAGRSPDADRRWQGDHELLGHRTASL